MSTRSYPVKITGLGTYVPDRLLTNADLERMVETNNEWIIERTGIRERHIVEKGTATSDLGARAVECLLRHMQLTPDDIHSSWWGQSPRTCSFPRRPA